MVQFLLYRKSKNPHVLIGFYFDSGKAFKLTHEWYYGTEEEQDEDGSYYRYETPQNYWWTEEIKVDTLPVEFTKYLVKRDWLVL